MGPCISKNLMEDDREMTTKHTLQREFAVMKNRIQAKKLPIVWMKHEGIFESNNSGSHTHACNIAERFGYACVSIDKMLKDEAEVSTPRGKTVKAKLNQNKILSDRVIVNILKERLVEAGDTRGYLINGFPQNLKQSQLFVKEIANVDCIILLETKEPNSITNCPGEDGNKIVVDTGMQTVLTTQPKKRAGARKKRTTNTEQLNIDQPSGDREMPETIRNEDLYKDLYANGNVKFDLLVERVKKIH